jgi:hypothetical protein
MGRASRYPVATPPLRYAPGEYRLHFSLPKVAQIEGRIQLDPSSPLRASELMVGVVDSANRLLPLPQSAGAVPVSKLVEIRPDGSFHLTGLPARSVGLWVGTREELLAGTPRRDVVLHLSPGRIETVEIGL